MLSWLSLALLLESLLVLFLLFLVCWDGIIVAELLYGLAVDGPTFEYREEEVSPELQVCHTAFVPILSYGLLVRMIRA